MNLKEIKGDLFSYPYTSSDIYVHCVSSDFAMGAGIAKIFSNKFPAFVTRKAEMVSDYAKRFSELRIYPVLIKNTRIVNLVTKERYWHKPTYGSLQVSLCSLAVYLSNHPDTKRILMPRIGCGLDRLEWDEVKKMIEETLHDFHGEQKRKTCVFYSTQVFLFYKKNCCFFFKLVYKTIRFCYNVNRLNIKLYKRPYDG